MMSTATCLPDSKQHLEKLLRERPKFHGGEQAGTKHYAIGDDVLRWMVNHLQPGSRTVETGCGYSTVAFALVSEHHTVIAPFHQEHAVIKQWCGVQSIPLDHVEFLALFSQDVLYKLPKVPLDMVLIDGDHAFPAPFIDWYYTADLLKCGGIMIVDDTQLTTGRILRDFLRAETARWTCELELGKTTIFRKIVSSPVAAGIHWMKQPYVQIETAQ